MRSIECYSIYENSKSVFHYNVFDDIACPCCDTHQRPEPLYGAFNKEVLFLFCYCECCRKAYIAEFHFHKGQSDYLIDNFIKAYPNEMKYSHFDDCIKQLSPRFINIYDQALTADYMGLDEIYGIGYRKALEFLVKDYLKSKNPSDTSIDEKTLNEAIMMLSDTNVKNFAHACRILGNDNTHYVEEFSKEDLTGIKSLITYVVNFITNENIYNKVANTKPNAIAP